MSFWNSIKRLFSREEVSDEATEVHTTPRTGGGVYYFTPSTQAAMSIATVYRCVQVLSDSVASLHLQYMRLKDGRYQEDVNSSLHYLLSVQPQPEMSIFDFWSMAVKYILLQGDAYIYPRYVMGELTDLVLCSRGSVGHDALNGTYTICDAYNGVYGTFNESEIIHLYLHSADGRNGESVLGYARRTMAIATAGDEETGNRFENGGTVRGIVSNDHSVTGFGEYQDKELEKTTTVLAAASVLSVCRGKFNLAKYRYRRRICSFWRAESSPSVRYAGFLACIRHLFSTIQARIIRARKWPTWLTFPTRLTRY